MRVRPITRLRSIALSAALLLAVCGWARPDGKDPAAALRQIDAWLTAQLQRARDNKEQPDVQDLIRQRANKAKAAVQGVDASTVEPAKGLAWAELYQLAQMPKESATAAERFLATNPAEDLRFSALQLALMGYQQQGDASKIEQRLLRTKPASPQDAARLAMQAGSLAGLVAEKLGPDRAMALIARMEAAVPMNRLSSPSPAPGARANPASQTVTADQVVYSLTSGRADALEAGGKSVDAVEALRAGIKRMSADGRYAGALKARINQLTLIGSVAPPLKADKVFGDFTSLESLRGKVVLIDFTAHW